MFSSSLRYQARRLLSHGVFPSRLAAPLHHHRHLSANLPPLNVFNTLRFSSTSRTSVSAAYTKALLNHQQKPESPPLKSEKTHENIPKISILPSLSCINQPMKETLVSRNLTSKEKTESSDQEDKTSSQGGLWLLVEEVKKDLKKINFVEEFMKIDGKTIVCLLFLLGVLVDKVLSIVDTWFELSSM